MYQGQNATATCKVSWQPGLTEPGNRPYCFHLALGFKDEAYFIGARRNQFDGKMKAWTDLLDCMLTGTCNNAVPS